MSCSQISFTPDLLSQFFRLEQYMKGESALARIQTQAKSGPAKGALYFNRWQVTWIVVTAPFAFIFSYFCAAVAFTTHYLCCQQTSRLFSVLSSEALRKVEQLGWQATYGKKLLVPSSNEHQFTSWDVYAQKEIPIKDPRILSMTFEGDLCKQLVEYFYQVLEKGKLPEAFFSKEEKEKTKEDFFLLYQQKGVKTALEMLQEKYPDPKLKKAIETLYLSLAQNNLVNSPFPISLGFFSPQGICRGASFWFIHLYLQSKQHFSDEEAHLIAVAKEFETGVPGQGAILQATTNSHQLLPIELIKQKKQKISLYELDHDPLAAKEKIQALSPGIYRVGVYHHSLVYIKTSDTKGYIWNPLTGLTDTTDEDFYQTIVENHYVKENPDSLIYFERYEARGDK